ncbi:MAG: hypothetical protein LBP91_00550 [Coriobacteriales bacterium]|jgi:hypothetical protein|nr:hypothetical protein [Coriobacteriales bacterium]
MSAVSLSNEAQGGSAQAQESSDPGKKKVQPRHKKKFPTASRGLLIGGAILLLVSSFLPWWGLDLLAPQYPEGLSIIVYPDKLAGQGEYDIVNLNALNHYIGMDKISEAGFPELQYIKYIIWGMAALIVAVALLGSRKLAYIACALFVVGAAVGLYDMYHWLQTFGSNLAPDAPIIVPPFVPPMIGENHLANFTTYSSFRIGFFFLVASAVFVFVGTWGDKLWARKRA